ncbi:hypothetical protein LTS03_012089, partial [Exophiala xenobiotica]
CARRVLLSVWTIRRSSTSTTAAAARLWPGLGGQQIRWLLLLPTSQTIIRRENNTSSRIGLIEIATIGGRSRKAGRCLRNG